MNYNPKYYSRIMKDEFERVPHTLLYQFDM